MIKFKHYKFDDIVSSSKKKTSSGRNAFFHMKEYDFLMTRKNPNVLEFGVALGYSTCVFINAVEKTGGFLYSCDIIDCGDRVIGSGKWKFIKCDDRNVNVIMQSGRIKKFDLIHIDSFIDYQKSNSHVIELLEKWSKYLVKGGIITVRGVDNTPYKKGGRKENYRKALMYERVHEGIETFLEDNKGLFKAEFLYGSVGMAYLIKLKD